MSSATNRSETEAGGGRLRCVDPAALAVGAYAALAYAFLVVVLCYSIAFFADLAAPTTIDGEQTTTVVRAVCIDMLTLLLFAVQHSVMARPSFKRVWTRLVPVPAERATFVLAASLVLAVMFWLWQPIAATAWHLHGAGAAAVEAGQVAGWVVVTSSTFLVSHADLFGLRQAWARVRQVPYRPVPFTERGLYRHVRHPLMAGFLVVFWSTPVMTAGHLLFAAAATAYVGVGVALEERDVIRSLGATYVDYRTRVPAVLPSPRKARAWRYPEP